MVLSGQIKKIGLLGGSFNPAHKGHLYISRKALKLLQLDEIWWLLSPQNPLKTDKDLAPFSLRLQMAQQQAAPCTQIIVSDFENKAKTSYTYDTLCAIKTTYPHYNFVWLMGADNLLQFPKWHKWQEIMQLLPIAVFNRDNYKEPALSGLVATQFAANKLDNTSLLACAKPPAWAFLDIKPNPISSTYLRQQVQKTNLKKQPE